MFVQAPTQPATKAVTWQERPPLNSGDHLSRAEFHRRYGMYPEIKKAELIEGVVIVGSPVHERHARPHFEFSAVLGFYFVHTPGLLGGDNQSVLLDEDNEFQPDLFVGIDKARSGQLEMNAVGHLSGAPEFVVEVAASSAASDLHSKLNVYRRNGVQEYLALLAFEREMRFWGLNEGEYIAVDPDVEGVLRSQVLPGFWFRSDWFWEGRLAKLLQLVQEGIASPEHKAFVDSLAAR